METNSQLPPASSETRCPICQADFQPGEASIPCSGCGTVHHQICWEENGGCGMYGCERAPSVEKREDLEIPTSYWGREDKLCPSCGSVIRAAAVRCSRCGAVFQTLGPQDRETFLRTESFRTRAPKLRRRAWILFVCSLIPCTAPFGAIGATLWRMARREEIEKLPSLYSALTKLAIVLGAGQTVLFAVLAMVYPLLSG